MVAIREDLVLERQVGATRVDEVEARQPVLLGHLLRAQVLLDGEGEIRAALDRRVVRHDDALPPLDEADARDDARGGRFAAVHVPGGERVELEEAAAGVDEPVDAFPRCEFAPVAVALGRPLAPSARDLQRALPQLLDERERGIAPPLRDVGSRHRAGP